MLLAAQLLQASGELVGNLNRALESRALIEQAKALLMAQPQCGPRAAFSMLRGASQRENAKLSEVARRIVAQTSDEDRAEP